MIEQLKYSYRAFRFRYKLDQQEINYLIRQLNPGDSAVDIGAHKGGYLYWMKKTVQQGTVYAFEPQVKLYNYLQSIHKNTKNITIENMGLSDQPGSVQFYIPKTAKGDSPGARIDSQQNTEYNQTTIQTTTLDTYFLNRNIHPQFIKIDVEGHEKQVILGGLELLKTAKPTLLMECENRHLPNGTIFDVFRLLTDIGYQGYFFKDKQRLPLEQFDAAIHQKTGVGRFWEAQEYINNFMFEMPVVE